ncbi:UNVERIFIED_CONTAM: hypothetical protein K2H54_051115 [Gekko kuhli]
MNRFAVLAEQTGLSADSDAPVLLSALLDENTGNRVDNGSPIEQLKETAADSTELILSELLQLTAKTVDNIFKQLHVLHDKVDKICKLVKDSEGGRTAMSKEHGAKNVIPTQTSEILNGSRAHTGHVNSSSVEICKSRRNYNLVLQPFKVRVVDIKELEVLDNVNQVQRILLSFKRTEIPSLILQNKDYLKTRGIFPARVFTNTRVMPLLPNLKGAEEGKGHKLEKRVDKPTKDDESNTNGGVQEPNRGTAGVNTQVTSLEMLLKTGDVEENIQESFITLPEQEQQWIINRLELLKLNLTKCRAEKRIVPIAPQLESLAEIHNLSPVPQAQLCGTEEVMEIQTTCPEEQVEDQGSNKERELVAKQAHKLNRNGSICPEANKSLEKIIELD